MRMFQKIMSNANIKTRIPFPIFDVYYFNWQPFVRTKVHDHAENGCLMVLMKGELNEKLYNANLEIIGENNYKSPNLSFINDKKGFHAVKALKWSKSIHVYYPKGHITRSYEKK
tara:strand:- start:86 stop:427 length:342 start_codon:yes stop_codon:yes gene_type:complete